jgi:hypothetical protein
MKKRAKKPAHFAVCIDNDGYEASLELGKLYKIIPDEKAESRGYIRVVDESGEDYGYSTGRFFRLEIPKPLEKALARAS